MNFKLIVPFSCLAVVACSSVEDQRLSETTAEDLQEVCEDNLDIILTGDEEGFKRLSCALSLDASGMCTDAALDECVADTPGFDDGTDVTVACEDIDTSGLDACDATVGDFITCLEDFRAQIDGFADLSCAEVDVTTILPPTSCIDLVRRCPELAGDDGDDAGVGDSSGSGGSS
ncbi:MAG: hypothetical protein AAGN82_23385, partial [Myxococcota bacterium]